MLRAKIISRRRLQFPRIPGVTEGGLMAVTPRLRSNECIRANRPVTVDARGLLDPDPTTSRSCVFRGTLTGRNLTVDEVLASPETHPLPTGVGGMLKGYEDQTYAWPEVNFRNPGHPGLYGTQAVKNPDGNWKTNIFHYNLATRKLELVLTPEQAQDRGLGVRGFRHLRMVKEPQFWVRNDRLSLLMECNETFTFIALGVLEGREIAVVRPFLLPEPQTWYSDHCAPAANPIRLGDGTHLIVFNGRSSPPEHPKGVWAHGAMRVDESGTILEISQEPWVLPPFDEEPGPGGQYIAFASAYHYRRSGDDLILQGFHHPQDRYVEMVTLRVSL